VVAVCLRRLKKVKDVSVIDFREVQKKTIQSPSLWECWLSVIKYSLKKLSLTLQKADHPTKVDPLSTVQNRATQRIILAAGLVVFLIALAHVLF
jgi:hypothetical protein